MAASFSLHSSMPGVGRSAFRYRLTSSDSADDPILSYFGCPRASTASSGDTFFPILMVDTSKRCGIRIRPTLTQCISSLCVSDDYCVGTRFRPPILRFAPSCLVSHNLVVFAHHQPVAYASWPHDVINPCRMCAIAGSPLPRSASHSFTDCNANLSSPEIGQ